MRLQVHKTNAWREDGQSQQQKRLTLLVKSDVLVAMYAKVKQDFIREFRGVRCSWN